MRIASIVIAACLAAPAAAQEIVQSKTIDLDGDGKADTIEVVTGSLGCTLQVVLAQQPDETKPIATAQELCSTPFEILPPGQYRHKSLVAKNPIEFQDRPVTFRYPAVGGPRRPGVRSATYWNGWTLASIWLVE